MNYANLLIDEDENLEAERKARAAYLKNKTSAYANFAFAMILFRLAKYDETISKLETVFSIDENYLKRDDSASQSFANHVIQCCNNILEQYNNDKVLAIRDLLQKMMSTN